MAQTKIPKTQLDPTIYVSGGTDVAITDGGTGASTLPSGILKGAGTGAITAATAGSDYITPSGSDTLTNKSIDGSANTLSNVPSSVIVTGSWVSWTPTFQNWVIGTGGAANTTAKYIQIGKVVHFYLSSTLGTSGQSVGTGATFTLPVTASSNVLNLNMPIATMRMISGSVAYQGIGTAFSSNRISVGVVGTGGSYGTDNAITAVFPSAWSPGDSISAVGTYEAA